jgi:hypothetical protein
VNKQESFIIARLHRDDLKRAFPEKLEALSDETMEAIARVMRDVDLAGDFWDRLRLVGEAFLADSIVPVPPARATTWLGLGERHARVQTWCL